GYYEIKDRVRWLSPQRFIAYGLLLALVNAGFPILLGQAWMAHLTWEWFDFAGLKIATTIVFEIAIAVVVLGSVGVILEAIGHPRDVEVLPGDESYDPDYSENRVSTSGRSANDMLPEGTD
ncbi:MAG: MnhB domain-containing protein, partial [Pseudomonadota bacterium]